MSAGKEQPPTFHCVHCDIYHSDFNRENHNYKVDFLVKSLVDVIHPLIETDDKCKAHNKDLNLVCLGETCNYTICRDCFTEDHENHNVESLLQFFNWNSERIYESMDEFQGIVGTKISELKQAKSQKEILKRKIEDHIDGLQRSLLTIKHQLYMEVDDLLGAEESSLEEQVNFLIEKRDFISDFKMKLSQAKKIPHLKDVAKAMRKVKMDVKKHLFKINTVDLNFYDVPLEHGVEIKLKEKDFGKIDIPQDDNLEDLRLEQIRNSPAQQSRGIFAGLLDRLELLDEADDQGGNTDVICQDATPQANHQIDKSSNKEMLNQPTVATTNYDRSVENEGSLIQIRQKMSQGHLRSTQINEQTTEPESEPWLQILAGVIISLTIGGAGTVGVPMLFLYILGILGSLAAVLCFPGMCISNCVLVYCQKPQKYRPTQMKKREHYYRS